MRRRLRKKDRKWALLILHVRVGRSFQESSVCRYDLKYQMSFLLFMKMLIARILACAIHA